MNRFLALPIFFIIMFLVYYVSISTVGTRATDFVNDGLFADGFFLFGRGREAYDDASEEFTRADEVVGTFEEYFEKNSLSEANKNNLKLDVNHRDDKGEIEEVKSYSYEDYEKMKEVSEPDPKDYGTFIEGIPIVLSRFLEKINVSEVLRDLVINGIVAGVGAVLGFLPQMFVLFLFLAFLEACGYMARISFIMDKIFRKFGLSGKSFIPMLIGTGCSVPGILASRTIENEKDKRMTIITTSFIPCGAKLPVIALISGAVFGESSWVAISSYILGVLAVVVSGLILKNTRRFKGKVAPYIMELPNYHLPKLTRVIKSAIDRSKAFVVKAATIIMLATILVWAGTSFGFENGSFGEVAMENSILAQFGKVIAFIFKPLGWGHWQGAVATITGLIAKENIVSTFGVVFGGFDEVAENGWQVWENVRNIFTPLAAYSFLIFNLLCIPCFAAVGAIRREMNDLRWTLFAVLYETTFAYLVAFSFYRLGLFFTMGRFDALTVIAIAVVLITALFIAFEEEKEKF